MNAKTVKLLKKYAQMKGIPKKQIIREWLGKPHFEKDLKKQQILAEMKKS